MAFNWSYQVRFGDTDGAGVVYFARFLEICHGAYEASLKASGIDIQSFFSGHWQPSPSGGFSNTIGGAIAVPIVGTRGDFYRPCQCGDSLTFCLEAQQRGESEFEVTYRWHHQSQGLVSAGSRPAGTATTRHVCIQVRDHPTEGRSRRRYPLLPELHQWLAFVGDSDAED